MLISQGLHESERGPTKGQEWKCGVQIDVKATYQQCFSPSLCFRMVICTPFCSSFIPPVLCKKCVACCPQRTCHCPLNEDGLLLLDLWAFLYLRCFISWSTGLCICHCFGLHIALLVFDECFYRGQDSEKPRDTVFIKDQTEWHYSHMRNDLSHLYYFSPLCRSPLSNSSGFCVYKGPL